MKPLSFAVVQISEPVRIVQETALVTIADVLHSFADVNGQSGARNALHFMLVVNDCQEMPVCCLRHSSATRLGFTYSSQHKSPQRDRPSHRRDY